LHFEKGENVGGLKKQKWDYESTGTIIKWRPDLEVFTDINIPLEYYTEVLRKQAVVNAGLKFILYDEESDRVFEYCYENGIVDYIKEVSGIKHLRIFSIMRQVQEEETGKTTGVQVKDANSFLL